MVNRKIQLNEKNANGTFDVLHPETTTEQVIDPVTGKNLGGYFNTIQQINDKLDALSSNNSVAENLNTAIQNTPSGGRLVLKSAGVYTISSPITITKDITIDGNNATITGNGRMNFEGNVEIYNTKFERVAIGLVKAGKQVKITNNKFRNIYDNAIQCFYDLDSLVIRDNEIDGTIVSTGTNKNFNNSGSFVYLNTGKINFLRIQNNRALNIRGGTNIFMSGNYPDLVISENILDTMAQRGIGFWYATYAKGIIARNRIFRCGVLKAPGEDAGVGCNAIYANHRKLDVEVVDNSIEFVYENGIEGNYRRIIGNTIIGTGMDLKNYPTPSTEGIFFSNGDIDIEDNTLIDCMGHGIYNYVESLDLANISIRRNKIINNDFRTASAICFRSPSNSNIANIHISHNYIKNYSTVIELPNGKKYNNVKIGPHTAINHQMMLTNFNGIGIDIEEIGNNRGNLIKNGNFNEWNVTTNRFVDWQVSNASLRLITNSLKNSARVTATDIYNGRITQTIAGIAYPEKTINRFAQLIVRVKGNNNLFVRIYNLDANGVQAPGTTPLGFVTTGLSETTFKTFKIKIPYEPSFRLELCNASGTGSWIEISEANIYLIDCEF